MRNIFIHIIKIFLPILFIGHFISITMFAHIHIINGVVIEHSHPYSNPQHEHTEAEFQTIFFLTNLTVTDDILYTAVFNAIAVFFLLLLTPKIASAKNQIDLVHACLRAPPYIFS